MKDTVLFWCSEILHVRHRWGIMHYSIGYKVEWYWINTLDKQFNQIRVYHTLN